MKELFTIEEIENYLKSHINLNDALYYLNKNNIKKANKIIEESENFLYNCKFFNKCQKRNKYINSDINIKKCMSPCACYISEIKL